MVPRPAAANLPLANAQFQPRGPGPLQMAIERRFGDRRLELGFQELVDGDVRSGSGCSFFSSTALAIIAGVALRGWPRSLRRLRNRASKPPSRYCFHFRHNVARDGRRRCPSGKTCSLGGQFVQKATGLLRRNLSVEQGTQQRTPENGPMFLAIGHRRRSFPHVCLVRKAVYLTTSPGLLHSGGRFPRRIALRTRGLPRATAWPAEACSAAARERYFRGGTTQGWRCSVELGSFWRIRSQAARSVPGIPPSHDNHRHTVLGARPPAASPNRPECGRRT